MKKSFDTSLFLSAIVAALFIACGDSSSEADSSEKSQTESSKNMSATQGKELYGISEKNSWSSTITNSAMIFEEACAKTVEFIDQTGGLLTTCYSVEYNSEYDRLDIILSSEYGYRKVWVSLDGCKYKLGSNGDFNTLIPKAPEWEFDGCICKVEKGETYYRNVLPQEPEESSSSVVEEESSSSEALNPWQSSSSSISYVPPLEAVAGTMVDTRDNHEYKTVTIGEQTWMAENLAYAYLEPTKTQDSSSFCDDKDPEYCEKYGRLYLWSAAMDSAAVFSEEGKGCGYDFRKCANKNNSSRIRGICPEGWHLPNVAEYGVLFTAVGGEKKPGWPDWNNVEKSLKSLEGWKEYKGRDGNGFDDYGFNVMPVGRADDTENVHLYDQGGVAFFWTSDNRNDFTAEIITFENWTPDVSNSGTGMNSYLSIRCLKD